MLLKIFINRLPVSRHNHKKVVFSSKRFTYTLNLQISSGELKTGYWADFLESVKANNDGYVRFARQQHVYIKCEPHEVSMNFYTGQFLFRISALTPANHQIDDKSAVQEMIKLYRHVYRNCTQK